MGLVGAFLSPAVRSVSRDAGCQWLMQMLAARTDNHACSYLFPSCGVHVVVSCNRSGRQERTWLRLLAAWLCLLPSCGVIVVRSEFLVIVSVNKNEPLTKGRWRSLRTENETKMKWLRMQ